MSHTDNVEAMHINIFDSMVASGYDKEHVYAVFKTARIMGISVWPLMLIPTILFTPIWFIVPAVVIATYFVHGIWFGMTAGINYGKFLIEEENKNA